ncbi:MAG: NAD(P)H-hydrate epimerase [Gammaproteobacteria bacterium]|nr:NAD(P)H-hydrate epimerase [Gammaproteobacteria bacterium]
MAISPNYYLAADVRELDRLAIEQHGIPGFILMQRAGLAAFNTIKTTWPDTRMVVCFCGSGNNGGDGYVISALAKQNGMEALVIALGNPNALKNDALKAFLLAEENGVRTIPFSELNPSEIIALSKPAVMVDALLGTGLTGAVREDYEKAIDVINNSGWPVLAVDIPSGLCSDTGSVLGNAIRANITVTFIGRKLGQIIAEGPAYCGELLFDDLAVPGEIYTQVSPAMPSI